MASKTSIIKTARAARTALRAITILTKGLSEAPTYASINSLYWYAEQAEMQVTALKAEIITYAAAHATHKPDPMATLQQQ